jgi:hypothetical protein
MTTNSERAARERLGVFLARLTTIKAADLAQTDRKKSIFQSGLPHFERTLSLFRQVAQSNLQKLPPEHLHEVADDAEKTLARFREILGFTGEGVENPKAASAAMISAVRDAYQPIYEKLSPIIQSSATEPEVARHPKRGHGVAIALCVAVVALAAAVVGGHYAGYHYPPYTVLADKVLSALR